MNISHFVALAGIMLALGSSVARAGMSPHYVEVRRQAEQQMNTQTVGEQLGQGQMTVPQVAQLVQFTGLSVDDANDYNQPGEAP